LLRFADALHSSYRMTFHILQMNYLYILPPFFLEKDFILSCVLALNVKKDNKQEFLFPFCLTKISSDRERFYSFRVLEDLQR
jgi:hypothetical protein